MTLFSKVAGKINSTTAASSFLKTSLPQVQKLVLVRLDYLLAQFLLTLYSIQFICV